MRSRMSSRKRKRVAFEDTIAEKDDDIERNSRFKEKHSLDSDEDEELEGDHERADRLEEEDVEGQEEKTIDFSEGGIRVTPFNLDEEMEEGHFDADGHYIADKDAGAVEDGWLETVDWKEVHEKATERQLDTLGGEEDEVEQEEVVDRLNIVRGIVEMMKPGETVAKTLRRLGGSDKGKEGRANKRGKAYDLFAEEFEKDETKDQSESKELMFRLTELADQLVQLGYDDIYGDTYEKLSYQLRQENDQKNSEGETVSAISSSEVLWQYKWQKNDTDIHGPFSSSQMQEWMEKEYFKDGIWVKKIGDGNQEFYSSKRIDFSLYID
ncbi:CD2 antigen cytoplasmic tail-binding protein 2-like [Corticium candelabrum]|uniref:CD2 antigen cytoplasmic tail-binding protein 2-like n=1 Tax=Corticium candelabrum TaxID=121492 RepID=UPI002E264942|nr:CD2 antigen cytoplasmic tail-binding protein 2-like [Corticium candelabrum]